MTQRDGDRRTEAEVRMQERSGRSPAATRSSRPARSPGSLPRALADPDRPGRRRRPRIVAFILVPAVRPGRERRRPAGFNYPADAIKANFELPIPHVAFDLDPSTADRPHQPRDLGPDDLVVAPDRLDRDGRDHHPGRRSCRARSRSSRGAARTRSSTPTRASRTSRRRSAGPAPGRYVPLFVAVLPAHPARATGAACCRSSGGSSSCGRRRAT